MAHNLARLRAQFQAEAEELRERLSKIETALKGLDAAIDLERSRKGEEVSRASQTTSRGASSGDDVMEQVQREAVLRRGEIRAPEFADYLQNKYPDQVFIKSTISHALRKAAEDGRLVVVEKGKGRRASVYRSTAKGENLGEE